MLERHKHSEAGYIGQEFFAGPEKERLHQYMVVEQAISEGYFSFEEALAAYEMDREEYEQYIARKSSDLIVVSISGTTLYVEMKAPPSAYFEIFAKMVDNSSKINDINGSLVQKLKSISQQLLEVSKEIDAKEKV